MNLNKHQFALYTEVVGYIVKYRSCFDIHEIDDPIILYRVSNILRLEKGDQIIFFDSNYNIKCSIISVITKKKIVVELLSINHNEPLNPKITWLLPLLKKEAFESALYLLTQMGVQDIQPLITEKTYKLINIEKDNLRNKKIMISAAEQSKQFILPNILPVIPFDLYFISKIDKPKVLNIFFDASGDPLSKVIDHIKLESPNELLVLVGPEGDLTYEEKIKLMEHGFKFSALTKTILRTQEAIAVSLGALRSLL